MTMTVWDELKVVLLDLQGSGALAAYPDPRVDEGREPPFEIRLQWWASEIADDVHQRFGDDVKLVVGMSPYPERPARRHSAPEDIPDLDPTVMTVELQAPIVVSSGSTVRGALRIHNLGADAIVIFTNGHVTAQVVDPRTGDVVGGFAGAQTAPLVTFQAAPDGTVVVPVLVGTASSLPELGNAVPAGEWAIRVNLKLEDGRRVRAPLLPMTVTN
jgi:hypothetical protein